MIDEKTQNKLKWREAIQEAIMILDNDSWDSVNESTKYDFILNGRTYPPKVIYATAADIFEKNNPNEQTPNLGGGKPTNNYLRKLGYLVIDKTIELENKIKSEIPSYKQLITTYKEYDEIYKWEAVQNFQNHWNLDADNLSEMIEKSFSGNLNLWSSQNYYPISMLNNFASINPDLVRSSLKNLLNENIDLAQRIVTYRKVMNDLLMKYNAETNQENKHNYQDARTISLLLSFKFPAKHSLFKHSVLKQFCEKFKIDPPKRGDIINQILINNEVNLLTKKILVQDSELLELHTKRLTTNSYKSDDYNILTQDFIYSSIAYNENPNKYYLGGAYWNDEKPPSQVARFIKEGVWINGYDDKFTDLVNTISIGSRIALKSTHKQKNLLEIFNVGTVIKNYQNGQKLDVEWDPQFQSFMLPFTGGYWETIVEVTDTEHINQIFNPDYNYMDKMISSSSSVPPKYPLNQILYGPPGTGKTYNTILRAAEIVENREIETFSEALTIFKNNLHNTIEFITFHQNYSYEDFIQGLRPDTENDKELTFERRDGVFKVIADKALKNLIASEQPPIVKRQFEEVFNQFINPLVEGEVEEIEVKMKKVSYFITAITNKSIDFRKASGDSAHTLSIGTLRKMYEAESVLDIQGLSSYYSPLLKELLDIGKDASGKKEEVVKKNFVIIIDEINRANISRVFGELITLIEPDKRSHGTIPLQARLPSGDSFMVPSNLYIIGTMNTADKSIALLDIALRRRFVFESMYPTYEIEDQEIYDVEILRKINEQIIGSKGHDFQIGHAYFMGENRDLVQRMNKKVIPLLLEYYMNDAKEVKGILQAAGLSIEESSWPIRITENND